MREKSMKSILDPTFRYTKSVDTDLKKTFARIRRAMRRQTDAPAIPEVDATPKVVQMRRQQH
jgi:hypothetical protein